MSVDRLTRNALVVKLSEARTIIVSCAVPTSGVPGTSHFASISPQRLRFSFSSSHQERPAPSPHAPPPEQTTTPAAFGVQRIFLNSASAVHSAVFLLSTSDKQLATSPPPNTQHTADGSIAGRSMFNCQAAASTKGASWMSLGVFWCRSSK